jgi:hypothetical protein
LDYIQGPARIDRTGQKSSTHFYYLCMKKEDDSRLNIHFSTAKTFGDMFPRSLLSDLITKSKSIEGSVDFNNYDKGYKSSVGDFNAISFTRLP